MKVKQTSVQEQFTVSVFLHNSNVCLLVTVDAPVNVCDSHDRSASYCGTDIFYMQKVV